MPVKKNTSPKVKTKKATPRAKKKVKEKYYEAVGRRKTAVARVRLFLRKGEVKGNKILINEKPFSEYFNGGKLIKIVEEPLKKTKVPDSFELSVKVRGGGIASQAQAVRLGIARALSTFKPELSTELHALHLLTRDPRMKERKKPGKRGARRGQQWSKR